MKVKRICEVCGEKLKKYQKRLCSRKCHGKWRSINVRGKEHHNWQGGKIKIKCEICGKEFEDLKCKNRKYCSKKCFGKWYLKNKGGKNSSSWKSKNIRYCIMCGKKMELHKSRTKQGEGKFCSLKCMRLFKRGKNHPAWKGGKSFEPYGIEFNNKLKEQIRKRDNYTCRECGITEEQLGYKLSTHHINYNKLDNRPENLISLCKSCHSQTNYKREDWTKYFQGILNKYTNDK